MYLQFKSLLKEGTLFLIFGSTGSYFQVHIPALFKKTNYLFCPLLKNKNQQSTSATVTILVHKCLYKPEYLDHFESSLQDKIAFFYIFWYPVNQIKANCTEFASKKIEKNEMRQNQGN